MKAFPVALKAEKAEWLSFSYLVFLLLLPVHRMTRVDLSQLYRTYGVHQFIIVVGITCSARP
jgi:hypothetical protein